MNIRNYSQRNFHGSRYLLLAEGPVPVHGVRLEGPSSRYDPRYGTDVRTTITEVVSAARERAASNGQVFFDSPIYRLASVIELSMDGQPSWKVKIGRTSYFEYVGTRAQPYVGSIEPYANPIGTGIIGVTTDGYVPLGRRAHHLEVNPGRIFSFGGFFEVGTDVSDTGVPCVYSCIRRELEEELGVSVGAADVRLQAIVYDLKHPHPEIVASVFLRDCDRERVKRSPWGAELSSLEFVHLDELENYVLDHADDITEGLLGGLCSFIATGSAIHHVELCT